MRAKERCLVEDAVLVPPAITIGLLIALAVERPICRRKDPELGLKGRHARLHPALRFPKGRAFLFSSAKRAQQIVMRLTPNDRSGSVVFPWLSGS